MTKRPERLTPPAWKTEDPIPYLRQGIKHDTDLDEIVNRWAESREGESND